MRSPAVLLAKARRGEVMMRAVRAESFTWYGWLKRVLASAIGGAVGNAVTQLARAQGAAKAISTTTNPAKAARARALGFDNVIDLSAESLTDGVARLTGGRGVEIVIDSVGGALTG